MYILLLLACTIMIAKMRPKVKWATKSLELEEHQCHHNRIYRAVTQAVRRLCLMDKSTAISTSPSTRRRYAAPVPVVTTGLGRKQARSTSLRIRCVSCA